MSDVVATTPSKEEIRLALDSMVSSSAFRGSKRCCDFATYVCSKTLEGAADTLKERTLAVEVFGRRIDKDPIDDNIVRVGAREVRSRLALYYSGVGVKEAVRIELPIGSYVPTFRYNSSEKAEIHPPQLLDSQDIDQMNESGNRLKSRMGRKTLWIAAATSLVIVLSGLGLLAFRHGSSSFGTFWKPAFDSSAPVLLVMAHPIVYQPSSRALLLDMQANGKPSLEESRAINLPATSLSGADFVPVYNQYVGFGDSVAALSTYSVFAEHGRPAKTRLADKVEFNDLYGSTVILIGGSFANRWTAEINKGLRYQFRFEGQSKPWIVDIQSNQKWGLASITDDRKTIDDYILICRIPHAQTGKLMVVVGGLTGFGTEAGGRILSDPKLLEPLLRRLPKDWASHNLEMLLSVEVVGDGPGLPRLVATHVW